MSAGEPARGRVALVHPHRGLETVPSLYQLVLGLAERGFRVEVHTPVGGSFTPPRFDHDGVAVVPLRADLSEAVTRYRFRGQRTALLRLGARARLAAVAAAAGGLGAARGLADRLRARSRHRRLRYVCALGVDPEGLVHADALLAPLGVPTAYVSLELLVTEEIQREDEARLKAKEIALSRRAPFVVVQDEARAAVLARENGLDASRMILLPNAPPGPARRRPTRFWHERFGLDEHVRVLLHAGSVAPWTGIAEIAEAAGTLPEGWALVVHTRFDPARMRPGRERDELQALERASSSGRVLLSTTPVDRGEYDELVDGADAGVAFYRPHDGSTYTGANIATIGLSSGKVAFFLRAGVPVIVNRGVGLGELLESEGCGVAVDSGAELGAAVAAVAESAEEMSAAALRFFDERLDPDPGLREVTARLETMAE